MSVGKVWLFVFGAVFLATVVPLKQDPDIAYKVTPTQSANLGRFRREDLKIGNKPPEWRDPTRVPGLNDAYKEAMRKEKPETDRGHMNPSVINSFDLNFMRATFTLTNAVPQSILTNGFDWATFERRIRDYAKNTCCAPTRNGTLYLLTGKSNRDLDGLAGNLWWHVSKKGVNLFAPGAVWTAGCCVWTVPGRGVFGKLWPTTMAASFAVMSNNKIKKKKAERRPRQQEMSVSELEEKLEELESVNLFPGNLQCRENNVNLP